MAKTAAQRQAAYRKGRSEAGENGERRINTWVSTAALLALRRLSNRYGVAQRKIIERLILASDQQLINALDPDSDDWKTYFDVTQ